MATLLINNYSFNIDDPDVAFTFPLNLTGGDGAYSTDFDLPMTSDAMAALNVFSLLSAQGQGQTLDGNIVLKNGATYPCKVRATAVDVESNTVKAWLTFRTVPEVLLKRVCDIAAEKGHDLLFDYFMGSADFPLMQLKYDTGREHNGKSVLPSLHIADFVAYVCQYAGLTCDASTLETDVTITPNSLRVSPVTHACAAYHDSNVGDINIFHTGYYTKPQATNTSTTTEWTFTMVYGGILDISMRTVADNAEVRCNGSIVYSYSGSGHHTLQIGVAVGDVISIKGIDTPPNSGPLVDFVTYLTTYANDTEYSGELLTPTPNYINIITLNSNIFSDHLLKSGFFGCFTQTALEVFQDIALQQGKELYIDPSGMVMFHDRDTLNTLDQYVIKKYSIGCKELGRENWAEFSSKDTDGNPDMVLMNTYDGDNLEDSKVVAKLQAVWARKHIWNGVEYAEWGQFDANNTDKFIQGESYFFAEVASSLDRLIITGIRPSILPQSPPNIVTATVQTYSDVSSTALWHFDGRDWLIVGRQTDADGLTEFEAVLLR